MLGTIPVKMLMLAGIGFPTLPAFSQLEAVSLSRQNNTIDVKIGGKPFTTYNFDPRIEKAFLQPLRNSHGVIITRGFPVGNVVPAEHEHDHNLEPHQRDMYFAHGDINGFDFWSEEAFVQYYSHGLGNPAAADHAPFGRMVFRKIEKISSGAASGTVRATFDLEGADHKPFAEEVQEYTFSGDKSSRVIDCRFIVQAKYGPVRFGDTKEGTFAIRLATQLNAPAGTMVSSEGGRGEAQIWGRPANWVNVDGVIDGQTIGVAIFDNPKSFRHPTYWHARGYGLLAANSLGLHDFLKDSHQDGSYTIPSGKSIEFRYRVFIHDGNHEQAHVAEKYGEYAAKP